MLKQVYRFLSIMLISELIFSPAVLSKPQNDADKPNTCATCQNEHKKLFGYKKAKKQKPDNNGSRFVTLYGVFYPQDIKDTYPPTQPNGKN